MSPHRERRRRCCCWQVSHGLITDRAEYPAVGSIDEVYTIHDATAAHPDVAAGVNQRYRIPTVNGYCHDSSRATPLHVAAGKVECWGSIAALLRAGADPNMGSIHFALLRVTDAGDSYRDDIRRSRYSP